jgi:superoxide dismutase, Fe-Mn family
MPYAMKPLACDPQRIKGMSERLLVSHYENNYGGAVKRLNAIAALLAELDFASAPVFVINGLKREELIATNSMVLHELFFASLGEESEPDTAMREVLARDFGSVERSLLRWERRKEAVPAGCCLPTRSGIVSW